MKKKTLLIGGIILLSLIIVGTVYAFQIGNVDGVWGLIDENYELPCQNATSLFFSEYVYNERTGTDRVLLEIYNGTGATVDLDGYSLELHYLGSGSTTVSLNDVNLNDGDVYAMVNADSTGNTTEEDQTFPDYENYATIVLLNGTTVIDVIGDIDNPNTEVPSDKQDRTFRRNLDVCAGDPDGDINYDEWTIINSRIYDDIGFYQGGDTDPNTDDATCSNWATGPTTGNPGDTTGLSISAEWFDQLPSNTDFNQIRYGSSGGDCLDFYEQSGMAFDGADLQSPSPEFGEVVPFLLGKFCHINNPIQADNALQTIHNQMTVSGLKCDDDALFVDAEPTELVFDYTVILDETTNSSSGSDCTGDYAFCPYTLGTDTLCPYAGGINNGGCSDSISSPQPDPQYFRCYYEGDVFVDYTVALVGFIPLEDPGDICDDDFINDNIDQATGQFISSEGTSNCGCVLGMITGNVPTAIELKSFDAFSTADGVQLAWETASEIDNLGFNIYRANSRYAQKTKINPELIESLSPGGTAGASYSYTDKTTIGGNEYFYWLEDIDSSTNRSALSEPVFAISAAPSWRYFFPILTGSGSTGLK